MATRTELIEMLMRRLNKVPNATIEDMENWVDMSMMEHGYRSDQDVPQNRVLLVLLYAEWDACISIALQSAHFFEYKDAEETVDKRAISEQYRRLASELKKRYNEKKLDLTNTDGSTVFHIATRADR